MDGKLQRQRAIDILIIIEYLGRIADFRSNLNPLTNLQPGYPLQSFCFTKRISAAIPAAETQE